MSHQRMVSLLALVLASSLTGAGGCRLADDVVEPRLEAEALRSAEPNHGKRQRIEYGKAVHVGDGRARTYVQLDRRRRPVAFGIQLDERALGGHAAGHETEYVLPLPKNLSVPPYTHVGLDYNPMGHPPPGIYTVPHFDIHFYALTQRERARIDGSTGGQDPDAQFIPTDYISTQDVVPHMGVHWADPTSPEFRPGGAFTHTMIYGFFDGVFAFIEPMVTIDFLRNGSAVAPVKQPAAVQRSGWYPQRYSISSDARSRWIEIAMLDLRYRTGTLDKNDKGSKDDRDGKGDKDGKDDRGGKGGKR